MQISGYSLYLSLKQKSSQRTTSAKQVSSLYLFKHENQNNCDHLECMVEKIFQFDDESQTVIEEIKNSTNLFAKRESIMQESLQSDIYAQ